MEALDRYGWDDRVESQFAERGGDGLRPGRVLVEHRGSYVVATADGEIDATVSGRFRHRAATPADFPAVGDWVVLNIDDGQLGVVHAILPRRSQFVRPARGDIAGGQVVAANVDLALLVVGLDHDFNLRRIERYVALAWSSGAAPVIVLNKADVCDDVGARVADVAAVAPGAPIRVLAATRGVGLETLTPLLEPGRTVALLGSSGVGKSTIVNALLGWQRQATREVRPDDQRGRHTTTARELLVTDSGALVIDSPGMRSVGMWEAEEGLTDAFADIDELSRGCRFSDCAHESEPGCAVQAAVTRGELPQTRLRSFEKLAREAQAQARKQNAALRADARRRWKAISVASREHARLKYGPGAR